jgi:HSP20 family molecular chaperone IbpA
MSRVSVFSSPLLLGFDQLEHLLDQASKAGDGYPPYNIERAAPSPDGVERWLITLAVAGFDAASLDVTIEGKQLSIKGKAKDDGKREFMHRGIAGRSFQRSFVLADGMDVTSADLKNGLLQISLLRPPPSRAIKTIPVTES